MPRPRPRPTLALRAASHAYGLPPATLMFCREYLVTMDRDRAARAAGLSKQASGKLLADPDIQACLAQMMRERSARNNIEPDDVLRRWNLLAFGDVNEVQQLRRVCCHFCWGQDNKRQMMWREIQDLVESQNADNAKLLAAGKEAVIYEPIDDWYDHAKDPNPECPACRGDGLVMGWFADSRKLPPTGQALFAGFKMTRDGFEVKIHDQQHALDMLAQHLGLIGPAAQANRPPPRISEMSDEDLEAAILDAADAAEELPLLSKAITEPSNGE